MKHKATIHKLVERGHRGASCGEKVQGARTLLSDGKGFTLVELIIVVAIVGALATMALAGFSRYKEMAKQRRCMTDLYTIDKAIAAYVINNNSYPATLNDMGMGNQLDPWMHPYQYHIVSGDADDAALEYPVTGNHLNTDFDLYSMGPDGASAASAGDPNSADDIVRYADGTFVSLRSDL